TLPKVDLVFYDNSPSVPHLNFSGVVKVHYPAAQLDVQFVFRDGKLDDVGIFALVFDRLPAEWLAHHNGPPGNSVYLRMNTGSLAIFTAIRLASSLLSNLAADRRPDFHYCLDFRRVVLPPRAICSSWRMTLAA